MCSASIFSTHRRIIKSLAAWRIASTGFILHRLNSNGREASQNSSYCCNCIRRAFMILKFSFCFWNFDFRYSMNSYRLFCQNLSEMFDTPSISLLLDVIYVRYWTRSNIALWKEGKTYVMLVNDNYQNWLIHLA